MEARRSSSRPLFAPVRKVTIYRSLFGSDEPKVIYHSPFSDKPKNRINGMVGVEYCRYEDMLMFEGRYLEMKDNYLEMKEKYERLEKQYQKLRKDYFKMKFK